MNKLSNKKSKLYSQKGVGKKQITHNINAAYALEILERLANEDAKISKRIEELAPEYLSGVDSDTIAENIFSDLNSIDVEDVWNNSGSTSYGYVEPYELASEMFEDALETYIDDLREYQKLSMAKEAKITCMGILKGIYMFEREATTEFKGWAEDDPRVNFSRVFEVWRERNKDPKKEKEMNEYVKKNFPEWYKDILSNK